MSETTGEQAVPAKASSLLGHTIKESIWEQVPIVIVPHGKDQPDNATRIRRNGLGAAKTH